MVEDLHSFDKDLMIIVEQMKHLLLYHSKVENLAHYVLDLMQKLFFLNLNSNFESQRSKYSVLNLKRPF